MKKLRSHQNKSPGHDSDDIIAALTQEIKSLHKALNSRDVENNHNIETTIREEVEEELKSIKKQKEFLGLEVARLQKELDSGCNESEEVKKMKKQVAIAEEGRTKFEKTLIAGFPSKLNHGIHSFFSSLSIQIPHCTLLPLSHFHPCYFCI